MIKRLTILYLLSFFMLYSATAQSDKKVKKDTSYWDLGSISSLTISQTMLHYWVAGGENSLALNAFTKMHANYNKGKHSWNNNLDLAYGTIKQNGKPFRKTDDRIELNSQYGMKAFDKFYYTSLFNLKTQFTPGYDYRDTDSVKTSNFMAPGYMIFSIGMNYKPNKYLNIYASLVSGKMTFVLDKDLYSQGAYGVEPGKKLRYELGAYARVQFSKEVIKNITVNGTIDLFSNYLDHPERIDVNANLLISYKANKYLTINIKTMAIYDYDVKILINPETGEKAPKLQTQEIFGLGLTFKLPE